MKKLILVLFLLSVISASAQIQRKFLGCTLGITRYEQVERNLEYRRLSPYFDGGRSYLGLENVEVGGYTWHTIKFEFYNHILASITFEGSNVSTRQNLQVLESSLQNKYGRYRIGNNYDDGKTIIETSFFVNQEHNYNSAKVAYKHKAFVKQKKQDNKNFW